MTPEEGRNKGTRMVPTGLDPSDGRPRFARVIVGEKPKRPSGKVPVPSSDELPPVGAKGDVATERVRPGPQTHASHVAEALDGAERRRDEFAEKIEKENEDI